MVCWSVCRTSEPCKNGSSAEPIKVMFGLRTQVGPGNHVLDGGPDSPWEGAILRGNGHPFVKYRDSLWSSVQKRLNRSRCHLGCGLRRAQGIVLNGSPQALRDVYCGNQFWDAICYKWLLMGYNFGCMIASDRCLTARCVFGVKLSDEDIAEIECLRVVAMATNFRTKIAITGFVRTIVTRQLVMEGGLISQPTECRYCRYLVPKGRCHGNHFLAFDGL